LDGQSKDRTSDVHSLRSDLCRGLSFQLWPAAEALCHYLEATYGASDGLQGLRVLELGAGTGLVGIFAARLGADVTLTDLPTVVENLEANVALNWTGGRKNASRGRQEGGVPGSFSGGGARRRPTWGGGCDAVWSAGDTEGVREYGGVEGRGSATSRGEYEQERTAAWCDGNEGEGAQSEQGLRNERRVGGKFRQESTGGALERAGGDGRSNVGAMHGVLDGRGTKGDEKGASSALPEAGAAGSQYGGLAEGGDSGKDESRFEEWRNAVSSSGSGQAGCLEEIMGGGWLGSAGCLMVEPLSWGRKQDVDRLVRQNGAFDLILASDVVYYNTLFEPLLATLRWLSGRQLRTAAIDEAALSQKHDTSGSNGSEKLQIEGQEFVKVSPSQEGQTTKKQGTVLIAHLRRWKKDAKFFKRASKYFDVQVVYSHPAPQGARKGVEVFKLISKD
jgi:hypothetical protein